MSFNEHAAWYVARGSGLVAWALLTASIISGAMFSARTRYPTPVWNLAVHRHLSLLALTTTLGHVIVLMFDPWLAPTIGELLVPGASKWKAVATAFGQVGLYLMFVAQISGLLKSKLPKKVFRTLHLMSFLAWIAATWHFLAAGSEAGGRPAQALAAAGVLAVVAAVMWRLGAAAGRAGRRKPGPRETVSASVGTPLSALHETTPVLSAARRDEDDAPHETAPQVRKRPSERIPASVREAAARQAAQSPQPH